MATYDLSFRQHSHTLEALTKAKALKGWYELLIPLLGPGGVTYKVFAKECRAARRKVVKVAHWSCPVDGLSFSRKEFVSHVRLQHGQ